MPRQKGMVLTERDRALLGYLGVARFITGAQAHRLLAPCHDKAVTSRRLSRLCEEGSAPGQAAYLERRELRRANSLPFPIWALSLRGREVAEPVAPGPIALAQPDVRWAFIERVLALDELLLGLVLSAHTCRRLDALVRAYYGRDGPSYPVRVLTTEAAIATLSRELVGTASTAPAAAPASSPGPCPSRLGLQAGWSPSMTRWRADSARGSSSS